MFAAKSYNEMLSLSLFCTLQKLRISGAIGIFIDKDLNLLNRQRSNLVRSKTSIRFHKLALQELSFIEREFYLYFDDFPYN